MDKSAIQSSLLSPYNTARLEQQLTEQVANGELISIDAAKILHFRDPRYELARVLVAYDALDARDTARFLSLYAPLFELDRNNELAYAEELARLAQDERVKNTVDETLELKPAWSKIYLQALLNKDVYPIDQLLGSFKSTPIAQSTLLKKIMESGDIGFAYDAFLEFVRVDKLETITVPYDDRFEGRQGPAPFNWVFNNERAEYDRDEGLIATFFGRNNPRLATQIIPLNSGVFLLKATMSGYASVEWGRFEWSLRCVESGQDLLRDGPISLSRTAVAFIATFTVPESGCSFARLSLEGVAGDFPRSVQANIRYITIEPHSLMQKRPQ